MAAWDAMEAAELLAAYHHRHHQGGGTNVTSDVPRSRGRGHEEQASPPARCQAALCCSRPAAKCVGGGGA